MTTEQSQTDLDPFHIVITKLRRDVPKGIPVTKHIPLPTLLRWMGSIVLLFSAATFILQRWYHFDYALRYLSFLSFTGVLMALGFVTGLRLKEDKGARTFLGLAAAMIPAQSLALGGFVYSRFPLDHLAVRYPLYAQWIARSNTEIFGLAGISLLVFFLSSYLAFRTYARGQAWRLTLPYLGANAFLMLPFRESGMVGLLTLGLVSGFVALDRALFHPDLRMRTKEGILARVMLAAPALLLIGRALTLYQLDQIFAGFMLVAVTVLLFSYAPIFMEKREAKEISQAFSVAPMVLSWLVLRDVFLETFGWHHRFGILSFCLPIAFGLFAMARFAVGDGRRYRVAATIVTILSFGLELFVDPNVVSSFLCLLAGIVTVILSYTTRNKLTLYAGLFGSGAGVLYYAREAIEIAALSPWMILAALGVVTILCASFLDRNILGLRKWLGDLRTELGSWQ